MLCRIGISTMRFQKGSPPDDNEFEAEKEGWHACKMPNKYLVYLYGYIIVPVVSITVLLKLPKTENIWILLILIVLLIPLHEFIHALFHPDFGFSNRTIYGYSASYRIFYAYYQGAISKRRLMISAIAPLFLLTIIPLIICFLLGITYWAIILFSLLNALGCFIDFYGFFRLLVIVPNGAIIRRQNDKAYWKID